jgi:hypothetical protein
MEDAFATLTWLFFSVGVAPASGVASSDAKLGCSHRASGRFRDLAITSGEETEMPVITINQDRARASSCCSAHFSGRMLTNFRTRALYAVLSATLTSVTAKEIQN